MSSQLHTGTARRIALELPGARVAALQAGAPDARPALLIPGYTGSKEDFGPILDPLAAAGLCVTAVDLPGQFESPGPAHPGEYAAHRLGSLVVALAGLLGGRTLLLGHSFGGLVARAAVVADPARFDSLVLLCSGPAGIDGPRRTMMDRLDPVLDSAGLAGVYAAMQAAWAADPAYVAPPPDLAAFLERRFMSGSPVMLRGMADSLRHEPDRVAELAGAGVPVLVTHGADDDAWPPAVQQQMAARLGARYAVIPAAAHSPAVENPAGTVRALLDFWAQPAR